MGKEKSKKRRHSTSDSSASASSSESEIKKLLKLKKKLKKEKRKQEKLIKKRLKEEKKKLKMSRSREVPDEEQNGVADIPVELMERSKAMAPMTKEEWDKKQSVVRRVRDEETGRYRLIKGDGEILEEIVSHARHKEINRNASRADGEYFQSKTVLKKLK